MIVCRPGRGPGVGQDGIAGDDHCCHSFIGACAGREAAARERSSRLGCAAAFESYLFHLFRRRVERRIRLVPRSLWMVHLGRRARMTGMGGGASIPGAAAAVPAVFGSSLLVQGSATRKFRPVSERRRAVAQRLCFFFFLCLPVVVPTSSSSSFFCSGVDSVVPPTTTTTTNPPGACPAPPGCCRLRCWVGVVALPRRRGAWPGVPAAARCWRRRRPPGGGGASRLGGGCRIMFRPPAGASRAVAVVRAP